MSDIEINVEIEPALKAITELGAGISNRAALMEDIAGTMLSAVTQNFAAGGRPGKWALPKNRSGSPLIDTGMLKNSITAAADNDSAAVGTNVIYAAIHNFGGQIKHKNGGVTAMTQREFLVLTEQDKGDIMEDVQTYFQKLIK